MSNKTPVVWSKNRAKLINKGPIEFHEGTLFEVVSGAPTGNRPQGSVVIDTDAKLWQATDNSGNYQQFSTGGGSSTVFDTTEFSGAGTVLDPTKLTGSFYPSADSATAFQVRKADNTTPVWTLNSVTTEAVLEGKINLGKIDPFGRTMIWDYGTNSVIKLGSLAEDGDPTNVSSEGIVVVGTNSNGVFSQTEWAYARIKSTRIGILNTISDVQNYIFRADEIGLYLRNDAGDKTFNIARSSGDVTVGSGLFKPRVNSTTAFKWTKADGTSPLLTIDSTTPLTTITSPLTLAGANAKSTIADTDLFALINSEASNVVDKVTLVTLKASLKAYFDSLYEPLGGGVDYANKQITGSATLAPDVEQTLVTYTVPASTKFRFLAGTGGASGDNMWTVKVNGDVQMTKKNSYLMRDADLHLPLELQAGDVLTVLAKNVTIVGESNSVSCWLYGKELPI